jgi:hypothetical protein
MVACLLAKIRTNREKMDANQAEMTAAKDTWKKKW